MVYQDESSVVMQRIRKPQENKRDQMVLWQDQCQCIWYNEKRSGIGPYQVPYPKNDQISHP